MDQKIGFSLNVRDPGTGQPATIRFFGTASRHGGEMDPGADSQVSAALNSGASQVIVRALSAQQVALPTLGVSLAHFTPEIVQIANTQLAAAGIQLSAVALQCAVPENPVAAELAAAPSPLASVASNFAGNVIDSAVPNRVNVNVGGFKVGLGAGGVTNNLADRAEDEVKSQLLHYAIIGGVFLFVTFICCGSVAFKLLF